MKRLLAWMLVLTCLFWHGAAARAEFPPAAPGELRIGCLMTGDITDRGYNYAHYQGLLAMAESLGLSREQLLIRAGVSAEDGLTVLQELIDEGCQIIFGASIEYLPAMKTMAEAYPNIVFSQCSGSANNGVNLNSYYGAIYQAAYLAGIAAGLKTQAGQIGFVAATRTTDVICSINAFALGVQSVNPDALICVRYTDVWCDAALERQMAEALLQRGCDVIAQHCDTSAPQLVAQEHGCFGTGYNADMTEDAPEGHLVAPVWNWSVAYTRQVQAVIDGTWLPENIMMDLSEGLVELSPLSKNCAEGTDIAIERARQRIVSGGFDVFNQALWDQDGRQLTDEKGVLLLDLPGTSLKAGEKITRSLILNEMNFLLSGVEVVE